jgi:hypothetical protein
MKVITRGIPNFAYTKTTEVGNLEAFVSAHTLRLSRLLDVRAEYFQPGTSKRVSLYVEGIEGNREVLERRCLDTSYGVSMRTCIITVHPDTGNIRSAGTGSFIRTGVGDWYMVDPKLDPRYPKMLGALRVHEKELARLAEIEQDKEDALRSELDDLTSNLGYEEAIRRLKGTLT